MPAIGDKDIFANCRKLKRAKGLFDQSVDLEDFLFNSDNWQYSAMQFVKGHSRTKFTFGTFWNFQIAKAKFGNLR